MKLNKKYLLFLFLNICLGLTKINAQIEGCTDRLANNYNVLATKNNGSCTYNSTNISPLISWPIPSKIQESSGLTFWNNQIWTHNDDTDTNLYALTLYDSINYQSIGLKNVKNTDWEEISQDDDYLYVGDFGNNVRGNRTDLHILRILKSSITNKKPIIDTIWFNYQLQTDFLATANNKTDFDCEAFIVTKDSIYLFTKEWISNATSLYVLPKYPGKYTAHFIQNYYLNGLITGVNYYSNKNAIVLCGYSTTLQPFLVLLYDYSNHFLSGNKRKISLNLPFHQVEGIATKNGLTYYVSNEYFAKFSIVTKPKIHEIDLKKYLNPYYTTKLKKVDNDDLINFTIEPNPVLQNANLTIPTKLIGETYIITDNSGIEIVKAKAIGKVNTINLEKFAPGVYFIHFEKYPKIIKKLLKQ